MSRANKNYRKVKGAVFRLVQDESGATVIEYGLMVALIGIATAGTLLAIGETIRDDVFGVISDTLNEKLEGSGSDGGSS